MSTQEHADPKLMTVGKFRLERAGVRVTGEPTYEEWEAMLTWCQTTDDAMPFWLGDLLNVGLDRFHEKYTQAIETTGMKVETLQQYERVAKQIPLSRRRAELSWSAHREVADLEPKQQVEWLKRTATGTRGHAWTVAELREKLNEEVHGCAIEHWVEIEARSKAEQERLVKHFQAKGRAARAVSRKVSKRNGLHLVRKHSA